VFVHAPNGSRTRAERDRGKLHLVANALNKKCYANRHGYDLIWDARDHRPASWPHDTEREWNKVLSLQAHLPHYDWVLWMDSDQFFVNLSVPVSRYLEDFSRHGVDAHLFVPTDACHAQSPLRCADPKSPQSFYDQKRDFANSVFLIRNSAIGRRLVQLWIDAGSRKRKAPCRKGSLSGMFFRDQGWMYVAMMQVMEEYTGVPSPCFNQCVKVQDCFTRDFEQRGYPLGHEGAALDRVRGPFVFSDWHSATIGLSFQVQFAPLHLKATAFSVHCKLWGACEHLQEGLLSCATNVGGCLSGGWMSSNDPQRVEKLLQCNVTKVTGGPP